MQETTKRLVFRYDRVYFYTRTVFYLILLLFALAVTLSSHDPGALLPWLVVLFAILVAAIIILGISPLLTSHWLTRTRLVLRRGWYFKAVIPLIEVASVGSYDAETRLGLSLSFNSRILFVTSSRHDLVEIKLKRPRRFVLVLGLKATRIVFNVDNPNEFLTAMRGRLSSLAPVKA